MVVGEDDLCAARTTAIGSLVPELGLARLSLGTRDLRLCLALNSLVSSLPPSPARTRGEQLLAQIAAIPVGDTANGEPYWNSSMVSYMSDSVFDAVVALANSSTSSQI